jgi:hypothetical protein
MVYPQGKLYRYLLTNLEAQLQVEEERVDYISATGAEGIAS